MMTNNRKKMKARKPGEPLADPIRERYAGQRAMGYSQAAALRNSLPKDDKRSRRSIDARASQLEKEPEIQARKQEILADMLQSSDALLSKRQLLEMISDELREAHKEPGALSAAAALVDKYAKMTGFYEPEKHDVNVGCIDEDAKTARITALLQLKAP